MRKTALVPVVVLTLGLSLAGCSTTSSSGASSAGSTPMASDTTSSTPMASHMAGKTGAFMGLNGKSVKGTATISGSELMLTGFSSDEGPDLHVYLTTGTDEAAVTGGTELAAVAFDKDTQTFMLSGVDTSKYTDVVIHCDKAKAVFGAAALS